MNPDLKQIQYILFDFDGTLGNSMEQGLKIMNQLRFLFGYKKIDPNDPKIRTYTSNRYSTEILGLGPVQLRLWVLLLKCGVILKRKNISLYPHIASGLNLLKSRFKLGVLTSAPGFYVKAVIKTHNLQFLSPVMSNIGFTKKHIALKSFLHKQSLKPSQLLYVGDEVRDADACQQLGIPFLAVGWGKDHPDLLKKTDPIALLTDPQELADFIL